MCISNISFFWSFDVSFFFGIESESIFFFLIFISRRTSYSFYFFFCQPILVTSIGCTRFTGRDCVLYFDRFQFKNTRFGGFFFIRCSNKEELRLSWWFPPIWISLRNFETSKEDENLYSIIKTVWWDCNASAKKRAEHPSPGLCKDSKN